MTNDYFPQVQESELDEFVAGALQSVRQTLTDVSPSNVYPAATWWRGEGPAGGDFVIPHGEFTDFAVIVRVGNANKQAAVAYTSYVRPDRGDEFDAAVSPNDGTVARIAEDGRFFDTLPEVLDAYLRRRLRVVQEVGQKGGSVFRTRFYWPDLAGATGYGRLLGKTRHRWRWFRKADIITSWAAFDEKGAPSAR